MGKDAKLRKIVSSDLLPVIYAYLQQIGLSSIAKKLHKASELDLESSVRNNWTTGRVISKQMSLSSQ